jgi:MoxR-like ATPase
MGIKIMSMNCQKAKESITTCIKAKLVPFLRGSPGVGKSSIIAEIAKDFNLKFIDFRLSQADPVDLNVA